MSATFFGILVNRFLPQKVEISGIALTLSLLTLEIVNSCLLANSDVDKEALFHSQHTIKYFEFSQVGQDSCKLEFFFSFTVFSFSAVFDFW